MTETPTIAGLTWEGDRAPLAKAFVAAQMATEAVKKANTNPAFKSKYADLAGVVEAVVPALNASGIAVIQSPGYDGELISLTTTLLHEGGSSVTGTLHMRPSKSDPQGIGSAVTYARRYALLAMTGAAPEDDDGNAASTGRSATEATITPAQAQELKHLAVQVGADVPKFLEYMRAPSIDTIPAGAFGAAKAALEAKRKKADEPLKEAA